MEVKQFNCLLEMERMELLVSFVDKVSEDGMGLTEKENNIVM